MSRPESEPMPDAERRADGTEARRLLVVTYHFGSSAVGGLRWHGLGKHLARAGWWVDVVTATPPEEIEPCPGVTIHHCRPHHTLDDLYQVIARASRGQTDRGGPGATDSNQEQVGQTVSRPAKALRSLRRTASQLLGFPDPARGWILPAALTTRRLLERSAYELLVSSGPPHSGHVAAAAVARGRSIPYWADMRDPWIGRRTVRDSRSDIVKSLAGRLERWVFDSSDLVLTNSEPYAQALRSIYPHLDVETIANGVDMEELPLGSPPEPYPELTLAHVGTIYLGRDLGTLLKAMRRAVELGGVGGEPARLRLVGSVGGEHRTRLLEQIRESRLEGSVELIGRLPRPEALDILRRSTFAVVLAQKQLLQVPAKLYECVALGMPTIVITEPDSATAIEGRRIGARVFAEGDVEGLGRLLAESADGSPEGEPAGRAGLSYEARAGALRDLAERRGI